MIAMGEGDMGLVYGGLDGWRIGRNRNPPYHVELVGPYRLPQVEDVAGYAALSGPHGAVFCASVEQAETLCEMANKGNLQENHGIFWE